MTQKEMDDYAAGFCKAAEILGVDPMKVAVGMHKRAGDGVDKVKEVMVGTKPNLFTAGKPGIIPNMLANEHLRRAVLGGAVSGVTAGVTSERKNRWRNVLLASALGGAATYGASSTGALDFKLHPNGNIDNRLRDIIRRGNAQLYTQDMLG